jgi:predicted ATPase
MFFTAEQIAKSIARLEPVHPFYAITFLVFKKANLPVGTSEEFQIDAENKKFLDQYYKPDTSTDWYYRPTRPSDKNHHWNRPDYAPKGLQSVNTRTFGPAFLHTKKTNIWGWQENYVEELKKLLHRKQPIPLFHLAVWIYRERNWPDGTKLDDINKAFIDEFHITSEEQRELFDLSFDVQYLAQPVFQDAPATWEEISEIVDPNAPPEFTPEQGGLLTSLTIQGVGPARKLHLEPAERLNLITGDNGLGKSFLLECAWWALTGSWTGLQAQPRSDAKRKEPMISFRIGVKKIGVKKKAKEETIHYDRESNTWPYVRRGPTIPGLVVYAQVDGSFAVWDPVVGSRLSAEGKREQSFVFTRDQLWDGQIGKIEGLIRDWARWQDKPLKYPFETFKKVLHRLSPPDLGLLESGDTERIPRDTRDIPTLKHLYGDVPILYESAGVRRIVSLAYLIVWAWDEHKINSEQARKEPQDRIVILIDEIEAHLHPQWQLVILPSLLGITEDLAPDLEAQYLITTHSPMIMASAEPFFDEDTDEQFHYDLESGGKVTLKELNFIRYGQVESWLRSDVFDITPTRSLEASEAIERAVALQQEKEPDKEDVQKVSEDLVKYLASDDEFWPRWLYFAEQHGVEI